MQERLITLVLCLRLIRRLLLAESLRWKSCAEELPLIGRLSQLSETNQPRVKERLAFSTILSGRWKVKDVMTAGDDTDHVLLFHTSLEASRHFGSQH